MFEEKQIPQLRNGQYEQQVYVYADDQKVGHPLESRIDILTEEEALPLIPVPPKPSTTKLNGAAFALELYGQSPEARPIIKAWFKESPDVAPFFTSEMQVSKTELQTMRAAVVEDKDDVDNPLTPAVGDALIARLDEMIGAVE